jgi:hypothetical protein
MARTTGRFRTCIVGACGGQQASGVSFPAAACLSSRTWGRTSARAIRPRSSADLTGNVIVGLDDLETLLGCWSSSDEPCCVADLDLGGTVGVVDFLILLANWGP